MNVKQLLFASCFTLAFAWVTSFSQLPSPLQASTQRGILSPLSSETIDSQTSDIMSTDKKDEAWTKPRMHNTAAFRSLAILGALTAVGVSTPIQKVPKQALAFTHMFSFASWFGTINYTTFVLGITMFRNLPRQTFGKLQAKLFPKYFGLSSIAIVFQMVTMKVLSIPQKASMTALAVALGSNLVNQFILEPLSTDNMMQRYKMEENGQQGTPEYKVLKSAFGKFHGMSSLVNLVTLCAAVTHGYYLSAALV